MDGGMEGERERKKRKKRKEKKRKGKNKRKTPNWAVMSLWAQKFADWGTRGPTPKSHKGF